ncbi:MAG: WbqC-like family [Bacteroidetes bacterium]|nr:MAG: WbqC-like family [Bacteroidota bacterium]
MSGIPSVLLPAACLPDVEFFAWIYHAPSVYIELHETYFKQTCRNRYRISTAQGETILSIPVTKPLGNNSPLSIVELSMHENWNIIHWRTIESAYSKSPFFIYYKDYFEAVFMSPPILLIDFNLKLLKLCMKFAGIDKEISYTENFIKTPENQFDMRLRIMPKQNLSHEWEIRQYQPYIQVFSDRLNFIPNLSILDLLFNLGPETASYLKAHIPGQ